MADGNEQTRNFEVQDVRRKVFCETEDSTRQKIEKLFRFRGGKIIFEDDNN